MSTSTITESPERRALYHASLGFPVIPVHSVDEHGKCSCGCADATCEKRGKHPRITNWQRSGTTDSVTIRRWWRQWPDANVGHTTCTPQLRDVVLDVDPRHAGQVTLEDLVVQHGALPVGPKVKTGSGGWHFYFLATQEQADKLVKASGNRSGNSAGLLGQGLDIKAERGQVVMPPSRHHSGGVYEWEVQPDAALPALPEWIIEEVAARWDAARNSGEGSGGQRQRVRDEEGVAEGGRHDALFRYVSWLRGTDVPMEDAHEQALARNGTYEPPLDEREVEQIVEDVYGRYQPNPTRYNRTDAGQADYIAGTFDLRNFVYDVPRNRWMHWLVGRRYWLTDLLARDAIWRVAVEAARRRYREAPQRYSDEDAIKAEAGFCLRAEAAPFIERTLTQLAKLPQVRDEGEWDDKPFLIGTPGGNVVDIASSGASLRPATPEDHGTRALGVEPDPAMPIPLIDQYLLDVMAGDQTLVDALVRAIGYSLTGSMRHQCFWTLYGTGANGKSVLLMLLLQMAGDYGYNTPFSTFEKQHNRGTQTNDIAHLYGRRFVMSSETGTSTTLDEERLKAWSAGDPVTCRFLWNRQQFTYRSQMHVWLAVNHKPAVLDDSYGFWRRAIVVPFTVMFGPGGAKPADPDLLEKLLPELPGFLWEACQAASDVLANGLRTPDEWLLATQEYRDDNDELGPFLDEACDTSDPTTRSKPADLYAAYNQWCFDEKVRSRDRLTVKAFSTKLRERGYRLVKSNGTRYIEGIRAKYEPSVDAQYSF